MPAAAGPEIDSCLDPGRDGDSADPAALAGEIGNHPAGIALLEAVYI